MPRPVHFEIHADDLDRGQTFYEQLFGWTFQTFGDGSYRLVTTGPDSQPGINGGMLRRMGGVDHAAPNPVISHMCTIDVGDVDAYHAKALSLGGGEALPKMAIPGVGWLVYVKDTEGNIFGMMQNDPKAA
ncbi:MAG TPA: VOC family protein [Phenylobacterium sp.]|nr:VOC family protein [Phenylobacterium sp.]